MSYPRRIEAIRAAERTIDVAPGLDPVREMVIALNGGYGAAKRNQANADLRSMLEYLGAQPDPKPFDAA